MSKKFSYLSAKEARGLRMSEMKRKRPLVDTSIVDDRATIKSVIAPGSVEPSHAKSSNKTKPNEPQDVVSVYLPLDGSKYSDTSFIKGVADDLLLPTDRRKFIDICPVQTVEWGLVHVGMISFS